MSRSCTSRVILYAGLILICIPRLATPADAGQQGNTPVVPAATFGLFHPTKSISSGQQFFAGAEYVGSTACAECHEEQYKDWKASWHSKMERFPSETTVVGDFNNLLISFKDVVIRALDGREAKISPSIRTERRGDAFLFTLLDDSHPENNRTYQVAKVLGGKWDQQYEIKIGDNYLPAPIRWSIAAQDWLAAPYLASDWFVADGTAGGRPKSIGELPSAHFAEAQCTSCHTTGFSFSQDPKTKIWKAAGNGELGIGCERCHGPGSKHIAATRAARMNRAAIPLRAATIIDPLKDLTAEQQTELCAQCHGRQSNKATSDLAFQIGFLPGDRNLAVRARFWTFSNSSDLEAKMFWPNDWAKRNRQQWQDFSRSAHFTAAKMSCLTCHAFHGRTEAAQLRQTPQALCAGCHNNEGYAKRPNAEMYSESVMQKAGVTCVDCHMSKVAYRSDQTSKGPHQWDVSAHTFLVATPAMAKEFGVRDSCASCHEEGRLMPSGVRSSKLSTSALDARLSKVQADTRAILDDVQRFLRSIAPVSPDVESLKSQASAKIDMVLLDGSMGFHNPDKAASLLRDANRLAAEAAAVETRRRRLP